ncbi:MAG: TlpA disulfide reductase family protein [Pseudomonadota bacterium]
MSFFTSMKTTINESLFSKRLITTLAIFVVFFLQGYEATAKPIENWTLKNQAGETVSLQDFKGKPVVLHFWATWCPYCKKLQPGLEKLVKEYESKNVMLVSISFREGEGVNPQADIDRRGLTFKTLVKGEKIAAKYGVRGTPTTIFLNTKGEEVSRTTSSNPKDSVFKSSINKLIES